MINIHVQVINLSLVLFALMVCNTLQSQTLETKEKYSISVFESVDGHSYLNLKTYEREDKNKRYYSIYQINGLIYNEHGLNDLSLQVMAGDFMINAGAVGKKWEIIEKIKIKKGDSINITFFFEDDLTPLHPEGAPDIVIPQKNN